MNSEKVKEIKKALEDEDYLAIEYFPKAGEPKLLKFSDILTLINELESENERLNKERSEVAIKNHRLALQNIELLDENQQIKDRIAELEKENARLIDSVETVQINRCVYKCELTKNQLKQFATLLKVKTVLTPSGWSVNIEDIDETLKEFIND